MGRQQFVVENSENPRHLKVHFSMCTSLFASASLPPSRMIFENTTFLICDSLSVVTTKLYVVVAPGASDGRSLSPPMIQRAPGLLVFVLIADQEYLGASGFDFFLEGVLQRQLDH
jgi:hypothetical protein